MPVSLVVIRQAGNIVNFFFGEPEGFRPGLFRVAPQAHRLVGVSPRRTQGSHHFNSSTHKLAEVETRATIGSLRVVSRDESVRKPSNKDAKPVASDGNFD